MSREAPHPRSVAAARAAKRDKDRRHAQPPPAEGLRLRARLRYLYHGSQPAAVRFRLGVIALDFLIIGFFLAAPILKAGGWAFYVVDYLIAAILAADLAARAYAFSDIKDWFKKPATWIDLFILGTLLFPAWAFNFGFLRLLRIWTLLNSEFFWRTIGHKYDDTRVEGIVRAASGLATFVFVVTGFVYATFLGHEGIDGYVDALYFTVTTLTTTGFGDVTLPGSIGKLLSIAIMLSGITLFLRLAQALIKPHKVRHPCDRCGLQTHDPDAVHCKACGHMMCIPDED